MTRFGNMNARFYSRSNLNVALQDTLNTAVRIPVRATTEAAMNGTGRTELVLAADDYLFDLAVVGRICVVTHSDSIAPAAFVYMPFCLPFEIEEIEPLGDGTVRVAGTDLLEALKDTQLFEPIGSGDVTNSTVAVAVADPATTTVGVGAPINNDSITLTSAAGFQVGDEIRVQMDGSAGTHVTVVTSVNPPGSPTHTIQIRDRLPYDASNGNTVERRRRQVQVATGDGAAFRPGVECRLTMDNSSVHLTLIEEEPDGDIIIMTDGAPDGAAVGKSVTATDYSEPATNDVAQITASAPGWTAEFESGSYYGTAAGTYHAPEGESVYDLLVATAKRTEEFFRLKSVEYTGLPVRRVVWRRTHDYAGDSGNLRLVMPGEDDIDNEALNHNRGIIIGVPRRTSIYNPVTRVTPYAGDKRITLELCSEGQKLTALALGYTVVLTGLGLYKPPYVVDTAAEASIGSVARTVTFSDIRVETNKVLEWRSAADELLKNTVAFLQEHGAGVRYQYVVPDIVCAVPVHPGQRVEMVYTAPDGSWSVNRTGGNALYVLRVERRFDAPREEGGYVNAGGVPLTTLTLVESPYDIPDSATAAAGAIHEVGRLARQTGSGTGSGGGATVVTGGTGSDHGSLTGLADDDHPQYFRADGTRAMTGSIAMGSGLLVDGVDIDAHAANPSAHHAPVTSGNTGLYVVGQTVGVNLASPSALDITDGLRLSPAAVGDGLQLAAQILSVNLDNTSGLTFASGKLRLLSPLSVSAISSGSVTSVGHSHGVIASSAPGAAESLLKTNSDGHLQLRSFSVGVASDTNTSLKVMSADPAWVGLRLKQRGDQVGQMLRIEKSDGSALLLITNDGNLESGSPGFVSGLTGFQIVGATGDAEFNNVRVRGELHATTFVADELHATGGTLAVMTATNIGNPVQSYDNKLGPIDTSATTYVVVNASWSTGLSYFQQKDIIRIHSIGEVQSGGSLYIPDIYLEVVSVTNLGDRNLGQGNPGHYRLQCLRKSGGYEGYEVPAGAAVVLWTRSGQGTGAYKGAMLLTADLAYGPYLDIFTVDASRTYLAAWPGSGETRTTPTIKPRVRLGNLDGVLGLPEQWGIAAGTDLSDTSPAAKYLVASDLGVTLRNIDLTMYSGSTEIIKLSTEGIRFRAGGALHTPERAIRWVKASGAVVAALNAVESGDGNHYYLELGIRPTFNQTSLVQTGIRIYDDFTGDTILDLRADTVQATNLLTNSVNASNLRAVNGIQINTPANASDALPGVLKIGSRSNNSVAAISGTGQMWIGPHSTISGQESLYVKFGNGVVRALASSV